MQNFPLVLIAFVHSREIVKGALDDVVALKREDDILYVSLYWRARTAANFLARVHCLTPRFDRIAVVAEETEFAPSGQTCTRPDWVNDNPFELKVAPGQSTARDLISGNMLTPHRRGGGSATVDADSVAGSMKKLAR